MPFSQCRLDALKRSLAEVGASAMYVRDVSNIEWLTGFENVFDDEQAHAMFVPKGESETCLHSDSRYITALEREAAPTPVKVDAEVIAMSKWARARYAEAFGAAVEDNLMAIEDSISLAEYRALEKAFAEGADSGKSMPFLETENLILKLRAVKGEDEVALMKEAQAVTDSAFDHICGFIN